MILCNVDNDAPGSSTDISNRTVDRGNDPREVAPLAIEPTPGTTVASGTTLELSVSPADKIRVFNGIVTGAREIIGPHAGGSHRFSTLPTRRKVLGMEALSFPKRGFDGLITITLTTRVPGRSAIRQRTTVRVAPWIMANHRHAADKVFVVDVGPSNRRFRTELRRLLRAAGCTLVEHASSDRWMQDTMQFGFTSLPTRGFRAVFRAARNRPLKTFPRSLLAPDLGYITAGSLTPDTTFDSHGNLEVSPPVTVGRKRYRYGRIYYGPGDPAYGQTFDAEVRDFLRAQVVQAPFEVDTSWLAVGHVDEVVTFVPTRATRGNRFKMLIASPRRAYTLLGRLARSNPTARMFTGRSMGGTGIETSVQSFLSARTDFNPELRAEIAAGRVAHTPQSLRAYNNSRQADCDRFKATMVRELGLTNSDIIEVPAIFMPNSRTPAYADALIPGMVNMLVANRHCIIPKPFGPVVGGVDKFEQDLRSQLTPLGLTVNFLNCWEEYHVLLGEVHCGTNTLRKPARGRWWRFVP